MLPALLVYDVTNRQSFEHIEEWLTELDVYATGDLGKMIVGNKVDLVSESHMTSFPV